MAIGTSLQALAKDFGAGLLDLLFPRFCAATGRLLLPEEREISLQALHEMAQTHYHLHPRQNTLLDQFLATPQISAAAGCYVFLEESPIRQVVHELKYEGRSRLGRVLGMHYGHLVAGTALAVGADAILPVPLHPRKRRERGYNQAEEFGRGLSRVLGVPLRNDLLARAAYTESQTGKNRDERRANVKNVFRAVKPPPASLILVDDVATTGATLEAAAQALAEAGAADIRILTIAVAP